MLVVSGVIEIGPDGRERALEAARTMAQATRREPGCLSYAFYADVEDLGRIRVFEEWVDAEALAHHFATPHMAAFREALRGADIRSRRVLRYDVSGTREL